MIEMLKRQPQTYETLLKENFDNRNTITNLLRNKVSIWIRFHFFSCGVLEGSRFGKKIFFHNDKDYLIVMTRVKGKFIHYYCRDIEEMEHTLVLKDAFKLDTFNWVSCGDVEFLKEELIKLL